MKNDVKWVVVHHIGATASDPYADTSRQTFEDVNAWHRDAKDKDGSPLYHYGLPSSLGFFCAYHYFIDRKGKVTQARADNERGYHTIGYNDQSLGIALAGNLDVTVPTWEQTLSLKNLLLDKMAKYKISPENIVPHRFASRKSCYGTRLDSSWARSLVKDTYQTSLLRNLLMHITLLLERRRLGRMENDKGCDAVTN